MPEKTGDSELGSANVSRKQAASHWAEPHGNLLEGILDCLIPASLDGRIPAAGQLGVAQYFGSKVHAEPALKILWLQGLQCAAGLVSETGVAFNALTPLTKQVIVKELEQRQPTTSAGGGVAWRRAGWHHMSTARMGSDPERSVVNAWGRCHDVKNRRIVDGSIFVTSAAVNPTSTIQALALYIGDSIKKNIANLFD